MSLTKESTRQLIRLQDQDKAIDALQASIDKIPVAIGEIKARIDGRKSRLADCKAKSTSVQLKKKEKEAEMVAKEGEIRKHSGELNQVKTNEAFKALQAEIDGAKKKVGDLETEILTLMDDLDRLAGEEKGVAKEIAEIDAQDQAEIKAFENDKAGLEAKMTGLKDERAQLAAGIPAETITHYEYLRKRKQGVALSPLRKNTCGACRINVPPQVVVEVTKGTRVVTCESCQRILYLPEVAAPRPA